MENKEQIEARLEQLQATLIGCLPTLEKWVKDGLKKVKKLYDKRNTDAAGEQFSSLMQMCTCVGVDKDLQITLWQQCIAAFPESPHAYWELSQLYYNTNCMPETLKLVVENLEKSLSFGETGKAYYLLTNVYLQTEELEKAEATAAKFFDIVRDLYEKEFVLNYKIRYGTAVEFYNSLVQKMEVERELAKQRSNAPTTAELPKPNEETLKVLENIKSTQARLVANMKDKTNVKHYIPTAAEQLAKIEKMDLTPYIDTMAKELERSFYSWNKNWKQADRLLGVVHFEWSYNDFYACAWGCTQIASINPKTGDLLGFITLEYNGDTCFSGEGFGKALSAFLNKTEYEDYKTIYCDYQITKIAEIFWHAMQKAVQTDAFKALRKQDEIIFELTRHERFEIIAYRWKKITN
jgi:tetratricopeptide (TPR) repeat protein